MQFQEIFLASRSTSIRNPNLPTSDEFYLLTRGYSEAAADRLIADVGKYLDIITA